MKDYYLITGAAGGIGFAVSKALLESGQCVVAVDYAAEALIEKFREYDNCVQIPWDLSRTDSLKELMREIKERAGKLKGFVHCAGFDKMSALPQNKTEDIMNLMTLHAVVPMQICGLLSKKMNHADGCSIVLISSLSAHEGAVGHTAYAAAKGAVEGFLKAAASELADKNIRINVIVPGVVQTNMSNGWIEKLDDAQKEKLYQQYPFGLGQPEYISDLVEFLLSDRAKWITGQQFIIDGGRMCR